jgi:hypothetical protein
MEARIWNFTRKFLVDFFWCAILWIIIFWAAYLMRPTELVTSIIAWLTAVALYSAWRRP